MHLCKISLPRKEQLVQTGWPGFGNNTVSIKGSPQEAAAERTPTMLHTISRAVWREGLWQRCLQGIKLQEALGVALQSGWVQLTSSTHPSTQLCMPAAGGGAICPAAGTGYRPI